MQAIAPRHTSSESDTHSTSEEHEALRVFAMATAASHVVIYERAFAQHHVTGRRLVSEGSPKLF
jgi:hypothetical protein